MQSPARVMPWLYGLFCVFFLSFDTFAFALNQALIASAASLFSDSLLYETIFAAVSLIWAIFNKSEPFDSADA